jgi:hypothetical protein
MGRCLGQRQRDAHRLLGLVVEPHGLRRAGGQRAGLVEDDRIGFASRSSAVPSLISSPLRNSRPEAAVVTAGTARPSAQGQVMIRTAAAMLSEMRRSCV